MGHNARQPNNDWSAMSGNAFVVFRVSFGYPGGHGPTVLQQLEHRPEPLDEDEIKHVSAILSSHLIQKEGTADE